MATWVLKNEPQWVSMKTDHTGSQNWPLWVLKMTIYWVWKTNHNGSSNKGLYGQNDQLWFSKLKASMGKMTNYGSQNWKPLWTKWPTMGLKIGSLYRQNDQLWVWKSKPLWANQSHYGQIRPTMDQNRSLRIIKESLEGERNDVLGHKTEKCINSNKQENNRIPNTLEILINNPTSDDNNRNKRRRRSDDKIVGIIITRFKRRCLGNFKEDLI